MLILTRKPGESLYIGDTVKVTIVEIKGNQIRVGIEAPAELRIYREEIYVQILEENKKAAEATMVGSGGLDELSGVWKSSSRQQSGPRGIKPAGLTPGSREPLRGTEVVMRRKRKRPEDEEEEGVKRGGEGDTDVDE